MFSSSIACESLCALALSKGFSSVAILRASEATDIDRLRAWIDRGFSGSMEYIAARLEAYRHPSGVLPGCRSLILLTLPYPSHPRTVQPKPSNAVADGDSPRSGNAPKESGRGTIAAYAAGSVDYHDWIREALASLVHRLQEMVPQSRSRAVVDTAPLLERHFAHRAGLGWIGKNTMLIHPERGSYFFLAAVLTDVELIAPDAKPSETFRPSTERWPMVSDHCGTCTACIDACPTSAIVEPRVLDASRCISHWTIEHRGPIPEELRPQMGDWLFGCDVCQAVCPWNRKRDAEVLPPFAFDAWEEKTDCLYWLQLSPESFRKRFRNTPFWRTRLVGMQRNAMIVAANTCCRDAIPSLRAFTQHSDPTLRELAYWALRQLGESAVPWQARDAMRSNDQEEER